MVYLPVRITEVVVRRLIGPLGLPIDDRVRNTLNLNPFRKKSPKAEAPKTQLPKTQSRDGKKSPTIEKGEDHSKRPKEVYIALLCMVVLYLAEWGMMFQDKVDGRIPEVRFMWATIYIFFSLISLPLLVYLGFGFARVLFFILVIFAADLPEPYWGLLGYITLILALNAILSLFSDPANKWFSYRKKRRRGLALA